MAIAKAEEQRELFHEFSPEISSVPNVETRKVPRRFTLSLSTEGLLLSLLGGILVTLVSFSIGVEAGRSLGLKLPTQPEVHKIPVSVNRVETPFAPKKAEVPATTPLPETVLAVATAPSAPRSSFIIQIASFKKADQAKAESLRLVKLGFPTLVRKSGSFYMVVVGPYDSKVEAQTSMGRLRTTYQDALIRKSVID